MLLTGEEIEEIISKTSEEYLTPIYKTKPPHLWERIAKAQHAKDQAELEHKIAEERKALGEKLKEYLDAEYKLREFNGDINTMEVIQLLKKQIEALLQGEKPKGVK